MSNDDCTKPDCPTCKQYEAEAQRDDVTRYVLVGLLTTKPANLARYPKDYEKVVLHADHRRIVDHMQHELETAHEQVDIWKPQLDQANAKLAQVERAFNNEALNYQEAIKKLKDRNALLEKTIRLF